MKWNKTVYSVWCQNGVKMVSTELEAIVSKGGYAKVMWCGERACEDKVKEMFNATSRCMPFAQVKIDDKCAICGKEAKY